MQGLVLANLVLTGYLTGLIWTIQVVHYPLFQEVGAAQFPRFHALHGNRISAVVALPMVVELGLSVLLVAFRPSAFPALAAWVCLALTLLIWLSTFLVSVPIHGRLGETGHDARHIARLVRTNWTRTVAWTLRLAILTYGLSGMLR